MSARHKLKAELIQEITELKKKIEEFESADPTHPGEETVSIWREFAENSPDHMLILGLDLSIEFINHTIPSFTKDDLIGNQITKFLNAEQANVVEKVLREVLKSAVPAVYETEFQDPGENGETRYYETRAVPRLKDGQVIGLILYSRESTIRKRIEIEVKEQRDKIQSIFRSAPIGIGMVSNRVLLHVNDFLCEMIGYRQEELINQDARILYPSREEYEYVGEEKYRQISLMGVGTVETRFKRKNGEIIEVLLSSSPVDPEDLQAGVTFSALDITERKQAEKALLTATNIIDNSPAVVFSWLNEEGWPVEFVSANVKQFFGYSVDEFIKDRIVYSDLIFGDDLARVTEEVVVSGNRNDKDVIFHAPYRIRTKNGDIKWVSDKTSISRDSVGNVLSYQGVVFDITKEMEATEDLRLRTRELDSLLESSQALNSSLDSAEVMQIVTDSAFEITGVDSVAIYLLDGEKLYLGATTPPLDADMPEDFRRAILTDHPHIQKAVSMKEVIILKDTQTADLTEEERAISVARGLRTIVYIPIQISGSVLGILILGTIGTPRQYSDTDLNLSQTLTNHIAISLQNTLLHEEAINYLTDLEKQINVRKQIEKTLIENEQNFSDLVENLEDGVAIASENGIHLFVNSKFSEITGYSEDELLKMTGWDFSRTEDQGKFEGKMRSRMSDKSIQPVYERIIIKKDGTEIPVEMSTTTTIWRGEKRPMAIIRDITERKRAEMDKDILLRQVQEANERLKSLSRELINSQEAERQRISQELHDEFGQALTAISLDLGIIERELTPDCPAELKKRVGDTREMADQLDQMIGELALDLRPSLLDDLGLLPTLNWYVERFSQRAEIKVNIEADISEKRLPSEIETALYRIVQEALTNIAKHSGAGEVILRLNQQPKMMTMSIKDDGKGFDLAELHGPHIPFRGLGLIGMGDRTALIGGFLDIQSSPGEGTMIEVKIPL